MGVLSTLQGFWNTAVEQVEQTDRTKLEFVLANKWSVLAGAVAFYAVYKYFTRPKNLPPGPRGLPIIGSLLSLSMNMHLDSIRFSEKYKSDIVSFYIGRQLNVMLNSAEAVKLGFVKTDDFSHRDDSFVDDFDLHEQFFTAPFNESWNKLKTFCISSLKTHGFGTNKSEETINLQLSRMIGHLDKLPDNAIGSDELKHLLNKAGACVIMQILVNQSYEFDDPELEELITRVKKFMAVFFESLFILMFSANTMPAFLVWIIKRRSVKKARNAVCGVREMFLPKLEDHRETFDINNSRDFMDDIMIRNAKGSHLTDLQMIDTFVLFTPDAIDTQSSQVSWVLFYACWHPEVQEKMVTEIKAVCGDNQPSLKDRNKMPYCEAVILESMRASSIAALTGGHVNVTDTKLNGYFIPKNTQVFANLYAVHYDERKFPEPAKFKPNRFLSSQGKLENYENVLPFGAGGRKCIGESLMKSEIFLYVTGIIQKFELSFVEGHKPESMETDNIYRTPPASKMKFTARY